jgi:hypothetical protein
MGCIAPNYRIFTIPGLFNDTYKLRKSHSMSARMFMIDWHRLFNYVFQLHSCIELCMIDSWAI